MKSSQSRFFSRFSQRRSAAVAARLLLGLLLAASTATVAQAQTFTSLYSFGGQVTNPFAGVTIGERGDLYGTATYTNGQYGAVYELVHRGSGYTMNELFAFNGYDGYLPNAGVVFGPEGRLYGTTADGGPSGSGIVYDLRPLSATCHSVTCPWHEDFAYSFHGGSDGDWPGYGNVTFDSAGNIYGTTADGGAHGDGQVYELTPSGRQWIASTLYSFSGQPNDGAGPYGGITFDASGNIYGTTTSGGTNNVGTIYQLTPSGQGWTESVLYIFNRNESGNVPSDTLVIDSSGNLYGTTLEGGSGGAGTVFELSHSGGSWTYSVLYSFSQCQPYHGLAIDSAGVLYGTCPHGGQFGSGMVYKLTNSGGTWNLTDLYDFTGGIDGGFPEGTVTLDSTGNLYGTTEFGGNFDGGTVWEITGAADDRSGKP